MRDGHICVAGFDLDAGEHVRPTHGHLGRDLLAEKGGPFELGAYVDLGETEPIPDAPHVEDVRFDPEGAEKIGQFDPEDYLELNEAISVASLDQAFGPDLQRATTRKLATEEGHGDRSLACLRPDGPLSLSWGEDFLELHFREDGDPAAAKITDLRYFDETGARVLGDRAAELSTRLSGAGILSEPPSPLILFGLGRALEGTRVPGSWHWLQVNGICFAEDPLWP